MWQKSLRLLAKYKIIDIDVMKSIQNFRIREIAQEGMLLCTKLQNNSFSVLQFHLEVYPHSITPLVVSLVQNFPFNRGDV